MKPTHSASQPNKIPKLNSLLQKLMGEILHPYLEEVDGFTTVAKVEVSGDRRWAKIWLSIIGGDDEQILKTLKDNIYDIQGEVNRSLQMKPVPRIQFFLDTSPRYAQHIENLLEQIKKEDDLQ